MVGCFWSCPAAQLINVTLYSFRQAVSLYVDCFLSRISGCGQFVSGSPSESDCAQLRNEFAYSHVNWEESLSYQDRIITLD